MQKKGFKLQFKSGGHHLVGLMNGGYIKLVVMGIINQQLQVWGVPPWRVREVLGWCRSSEPLKFQFTLVDYGLGTFSSLFTGGYEPTHSRETVFNQLVYWDGTGFFLMVHLAILNGMCHFLVIRPGGKQIDLSFCITLRLFNIAMDNHHF